MGFLGWLALLLIGLKLTGYIAWSWWAVTAPLWIPAALVVTSVAVAAALGLAVRFFASK